MCIVCLKKYHKTPAQKRIDRAADPERHRSYDRKYRAGNIEKARQKDRDVKRWFRALHPEVNKLRARKWRKENPEKAAAYSNARRASKIQAAPKWADDFIISEAYSLARLREKVCGGKWHVDHIVPLKSKLVCGLHWEKNFQVIPSGDNRKKGNRYWPDMP